ncbi:MAG TPA: hypothetical protein DCX14_03800 [Flavobacteriales bacterium]|nr:hypothetical protein [Flavobacteriales bacterium]
MFRIDNLTKSYRISGKRHYVFRNLNLDIPEGVNIGILGPNGAGKSTLLRILGGIDFPDSGKVVSDFSVSWPLGLRGGFVNHMSGRENCKMVANLYGLDHGRMRSMISKIRDLSGVGDYFDEPVKYYSSGMSSRLGFALSMSFDFDYFLIDEITSVGDAGFKKMAREALREKAKKSRVIMVSHNLGDLQRFCDIAIYIKDGNLSVYSTIEEAVNQYLKTESKINIDELNSEVDEGRASRLLRSVGSNDELYALKIEFMGRLKKIVGIIDQSGGLDQVTDVQSIFDLGRTYSRLCDYKNAYKCFLRADSISPGRLVVLVELANVAYEMDLDQVFLKSIQRIEKVDPNNFRANNLIVKYYDSRGDFSKAAKYQEKLVEGSPDKGRMWSRLAGYYKKLGRHKASLNAQLRAVRSDKENTTGYRRLAEYFANEDRIDQALDAKLKELELAKNGQSPSEWLMQLSSSLAKVEINLE